MRLNKQMGKGIMVALIAHHIPTLTTYINQWHTQEFFSGGGSTNSVEDRGQTERGSGGGSPIVRGYGGSCNLVQEILFHMVTFSSFLVL